MDAVALAGLLSPPDPAYSLSAAKAGLLRGRGAADDPRLGEVVRGWSGSAQLAARLDEHPQVVILGHPSDEGVRRNRGRAGAAQGPAALRRSLYACTPGARSRIHEHLRILDLGDAPTEALPVAVAAVVARGAAVVVLGGGHDTTEGGVRGLAQGLAEAAQAAGVQPPGQAPGLVTIDAHPDVRPDPPGTREPNSGTPFRRLLEDGVVAGARMSVLGLAEHRTAAAHLDWLLAQGAQAVFLDELRAGGPGAFAEAFAEALGRAASGGAAALSVDMDAMPLAGVSAVAGTGLAPADVVAAARRAGNEPAVRYLDVVECAPGLDPTGRTAAVGAELVFEFLRGRSLVSDRSDL